MYLCVLNLSLFDNKSSVCTSVKKCFYSARTERTKTNYDVIFTDLATDSATDPIFKFFLT